MGDAVKNFNRLIDVHNRFHCEFCRRDYETALDDSIQVSFTIHPEIRKILFHDPFSLSIEDYQYKYHFSREGKVPGLGITFREFFKVRERFLKFLEPKEEIRTEIQVEEGFLEGNDFIHHSDFLIQVMNAGNDRYDQINIAYTGEKFTFDQTQVSPGLQKFHITNLSDSKIPLSIYQLDIDFMKTNFGLAFDKFLTPRFLLNYKTFRDLFKGEDIVGSSGLAIKDITILFTDLKGSTNLYERIGDIHAFSLVQQHFDEVSQVINRHNGILIKTIGDAMMASFLNPLDAVRASIEMLDAIENFNARQFEKEIVLKIGIHTGPSIAVTLNDRLDYFGQIINIAARVQGIANSEEICFTREVYQFPGVADLFKDGPVTFEDVQLKGIKKQIPIVRLRYPKGKKLFFSGYPISIQ